ncbi:hypothetical protein B0H12DRAFT_1073593 [Mycena haematopus]|nr:hypothetical protein B0H12DRAFT_1073593 [Mycena haematopus]
MYFKEGPLPVLSKHEDDALYMVIYDLEMAAEEYIVDDLHRAIRQVWEVALRIGVKHGQQQARQAHVHTSKELERERVWGFDVGWKLAVEESALKASKESVPGPSLPCLASFSTTSMQTDPLSFAETTILASTASTQTDTPIPSPSIRLITNSPAASSPLSRPFDDKYVDIDVDVSHDAPKLPPDSLPSPSSFVRDFSDLCTGTSRPFASLRRRHRRTPRVSGSHSSSAQSSRAAKTIVLNIYESKPKKSRVRYPDPRTFLPIPCSYAPTPSPDENSLLDWGHDPRLRDLSRALTALGWVRPG